MGNFKEKLQNFMDNPDVALKEQVAMFRAYSETVWVRTLSVHIPTSLCMTIPVSVQVR